MEPLQFENENRFQIIQKKSEKSTAFENNGFFLRGKKFPQRKEREKKSKAADKTAEKRFVKNMTIFAGQCAENGEIFTGILCNMLIESFGLFLYTKDTPKKVFGFWKVKTADFIKKAG